MTSDVLLRQTPNLYSEQWLLIYQTVSPTTRPLEPALAEMLEDEDDDSVEHQLHHDLKHSILRAQQSNRPILTHLNADTSWLLALPYPEKACPPLRSHYNILIDAWLDGTQVDVASWFSKQWHATPSSVKTIAELNHLLHERETQHGTTNVSEDAADSYIDLVVCSHEFTDHCHRATLEQVHPTVPVIASSSAAVLVRSWHHFITVVEMPILPHNLDWKSISIPVLPQWVVVGRLVPSSWKDPLLFHSGVVFFVDPDTTGCAESIVYTAHGIYPEYFQAFEHTRPTVRTLALIHGQDEFAIVAKGGGTIARLNLGAHNALKVQRHLKARYWIGTHDETKHKAGLIAYTLQQTPISAKDLLEEQADGITNDHLKVGYFELGSGESVLLD